MKKIIFFIDKMECSHCVATINSILKKFKANILKIEIGIAEFELDDFNDDVIETIKRDIEENGFIIKQIII
jgi:copper chaperone CopZ